MTQDPTPGLSPEKVAELEKKLADAAAEVARVQAQLAAATPGTPGTPSTPSAGATAPAVPYGAPEPHVITINGQQVVPGTGNLFQVLQQLGAAGTLGTAGAAGATATAGTAPVVVVNGQVVSGGQPLDLSTYLTPQVTQRIQESLGHLGLDGGLGALFGHAAPPTAPPSATTVEPLAEPPRPVPLAFRLATFDLSVWEVFGLLMFGVAPIAVWMSSADARAVGLVVAVVAVVVFRVRRYVRRIGMLKWGKVATVSNQAEIARGTYYSGTTYQNMYLRQAHGWDTTSRLYSGPGSTTQVDYQLDGQNGTLKVRGLPYEGGVVLADSRKPSRAMVVSQFPYAVKPDASGHYVGRLTPWRWGGVVATLVIEATLVYVAVHTVLVTWFSS